MKRFSARTTAESGRLRRIWPRFLAVFGWEPTSGVLARVRAGIALVVLPLTALGVVLAATDVTAPDRRTLPAAAALAAAWWLWWRCARGRPSSPLTNAIETFLLFGGLLLEGKGVWVFSAVAVALFLRAAFGSHEEFVARGVLWSAVTLASAVIRANWGWAPWWLRVVDTLWFLPSYLMAGGLIRVVVAVLERHEAALARERVLLGAGVSLVSSTSKEDIYQVALDAIVGLVDSPGVEANIDEKTVEGTVRVASRRGLCPAAEAPSPAAYEMRLEVRRELLTVITVNSAEPLPGESVEALQHLESNLALAIRSASLTDELRRQAHYDVVTGLPNRALLYERLGEVLRPDQRETVALLLVDLDSFKQVNDTLGHEGGDVLLSHVGQALRSCTRPTDTPARLGGDEFAVLLVGVEGPEDALTIGDRIVEKLSTPVTVGGVEIMPSGSIGVAVWDGVSGPDELLRAADTAMYSAKSAGKGRSHLFRQSMVDEARQRMGLEDDLRDGLDAGELECHYQPIIDVNTGAIDAVEALVRWRRPGHGLLLPGEFLKAAEDGGLMPRLGEHVLRCALEDFASWRADAVAEAPRRIAVNVSPQELIQPDLAARVERALGAAGVDPGCLVVELSETTVLDGNEVIISNLHALRALGVDLALDDFGRGQSSLSYLHRLPIQILKIDRAFVAEIGRLAATAELTGGIIDIARRLRLTTVAEGVEREDQLECLRRLGCDLVQGYLLSAPVAEAELRSLLAGKVAA